MFPILAGSLHSCTFTEILAVSGAGSFFFTYNYPYLYVTDEGTSFNGVLKIFDVTRSPAVPLSTTSLPNSSGPVHPYYKDNFLYIPYRNSKKIGIWNVSDRTAPSMVSETTVSFAPNGAAVIGTTLCVCFNENFLQTKTAETYDITVPASPSLANSWSASKLGFTVRASTSHFFISGQNSSGGVQHLTALVASTLAVADTATTPTAPSGTAAGKLVLNAAFTRALSGGSNGDTDLHSWDISDPTNLILLASTNAGTGQITCLAWNEDTNRLYNGSTAAVQITNVSNLSAPSHTGTISTSSESVTDVGIIASGCNGLAWGQGTGAAIHMLGTAPLS